MSTRWRRATVLPFAGAALAIAGAGFAGGGRSHAQAQAARGVIVTYRSAGGATDTAVLPHVALYTAAGAAPSPFLPSSPFTAEIEGQLSVDLRDDYRFRVELSGSARVSINDAVVLTAQGPGDPVETARPVRLHRGANRITVRYAPPASGDAYLRVYWSSPAIDWEPIPASALSRPAGNAAVEASEQARLGRMLVLEYRCTRCHEAPAPEGAGPLQMDAPDFEGIGLRRNQDWMARWIADPQALRATARMPTLLHTADSASAAADIAAYLATRREGEPPPDAPAGDPAIGEELYSALRCAVCHEGSGDEAGLRQRISLEKVRDKFPPGALAEFLRQPNRHFASIAMPDFNLTDEEAASLAAWLESQASDPPPTAPAGDATRGEALLKERGCLTCHAPQASGRYAGAAAFADLPAASWSTPWHDTSSAAAAYQLTPAERQAIQAFARSDVRALGRETPAEFAAAQVSRLNCAGCHDTIERIPRLEVTGGKLRPEWTRKLLDGSLPYKPRPWIEVRMPAFGAYAGRFPAGLAAQHGYPPTAPLPDEPVDKAAADIGRKMVVSGGCANCHNVGEFVGGQSTSTAGINFAYTAERLRYPYFHRWMLNPPRVWPETVMPRYFSGGKGPFAFSDDSIDKQIRALWEYMRLGPNMPAPQ